MSILHLHGIRAVITGAGSGIGLATARAIVTEGGQVAALDLLPPNAEEGIFAVACDVTDDAAVQRAVAEAAELLGGIDVVVNNAGIAANGTVADNDLDEWRRVLDVNLLGVVRVSRASLDHLRASDHAAIVNVSSVVAWTGLPNRALYGASKGAVYSLTLAMASDHAADGIRVNCVCPGTVDTPWVGRLLEAAPDAEQLRAQLVARQPIGRLGTAEEVAAAICYLASPAAGYTTGAALQIDGGIHSFQPRRA